jgi:hypothetical protein
MKRGLVATSALAAAIIASPVPAAAQGPSPPSSADVAPPASDVATAGELFRQGRVAFEAKDFPTARARLMESARLNPRVGTFISLAECEEVEGLLASARAHWQQAVDLGTAQGDARADFARQHLASIDPRVPRMTLRLPADAPPGTTVRVDETDLGTASVGLALPAEVGPHVVLVLAPGLEPSRAEVVLAEGESREVTLEIGRPLPPPAPAAVPAPASPAPDSGTRTHVPLRIASYAVMGLALVGAGVGSYFGVKAIDGKEPPGCTGNRCNGPGATIRDAAIGDGNVATVLFVTSGALLATGAALWFFSRPTSTTPARTAIEWTPAIDARGASVVARVRW